MELMKPPFDKPQSMIRLFDGSGQKKIVEAVKKIKEPFKRNELYPAAYLTLNQGQGLST
ncbi:MAG: Helicase, type I site-specific restriction-modification system restriction subunit [Desulfotomaculum sp. 46_296]|nr:MAG: Helicase, type I site-specific restriction-modification system restriction subunit [Desulfotomaculum sp. 46_296]